MTKNAIFYTSIKSEGKPTDLKKSMEEDSNKNKYEALFSKFSNHLRLIDEELFCEKKIRNTQLTEIISALLNAEAKLRREQKSILKVLHEKDSIISYQLNEIETYKKVQMKQQSNLCFKCQRPINYETRSIETQTIPSRETKPIIHSRNGFIEHPSTNYKHTNHVDEANKNIYLNMQSMNEDAKQNYSLTAGTSETISYQQHFNSLQRRNCIVRHENVPIVTKSGDGKTENKSHSDNSSEENRNFGKENHNFDNNEDNTDTNDDWYSSASDAEDSDCISMRHYDRSVNPVLECVNQILLQQSIDGPMDNSNNFEETKPKRVQFSTQNSMVPIPCNISNEKYNHQNHNNYHHQPAPQQQQLRRKEDKKSSCNDHEYELVGSDKESSNLYVDMDQKSYQSMRSNYKRLEITKIPPALPPKPANLINFRKIIKPKVMTKPNTPIKQLIEPDYCSISEIDSKDGNGSVISEKTKSECDELENVPKLPNVAAILIPKKDNLGKFINKDNYVTKSVVNINKSSENVREQNNNQNTNYVPPVVTPKKTNYPECVEVRLTNKIFEERIPIQAEFDWYNLDAEYGKFNQPDIIKETEGGDEETLICINECSDGKNNTIEDTYYLRPRSAMVKPKSPVSEKNPFKPIPPPPPKRKPLNLPKWDERSETENTSNKNYGIFLLNQGLASKSIVNGSESEVVHLC